MLSGNPASVTAGTASSVTVTAEDAYGNTTPAYTGTVTFSSTDGSATLPGDYTFVGGDNGVHAFTNGVTLTTVGTQTVTATDTVTGSIAGTTSAIAVDPAGAATLAVVASPHHDHRRHTTSVTVTAKDAYGNIATGYTGTVHFTSTDGSATLPEQLHLHRRRRRRAHLHALTLKTAGSRAHRHRHRHRLDHRHQRRSLSTRRRPRPSTSARAGSSTAGNAVNVTVTARDAYGNVATGYTGTVHLTSTDAGATLPADYTFVAGDNGAHTLSRHPQDRGRRRP